ncbi:MAG: hypothetical protein L0H93_13745 [Nocardioides sp.]|nr:hypothetical protein [Nocardioides sp.]
MGTTATPSSTVAVRVPATLSTSIASKPETYGNQSVDCWPSSSDARASDGAIAAVLLSTSPGDIPILMTGSSPGWGSDAAHVPLRGTDRGGGK